MDQVIKFVSKETPLPSYGPSGTYSSPNEVELDLDGVKVTGYVHYDNTQFPAKTIVVYEDMFVRALFLSKLNKKENSNEQK